MPTVRVATFNVENLFARFKFESKVDPMNAVREGWNVDETKFVKFSSDEKKITGQALRAIKADVLALQEVENIDTLKRFRTQYLKGFRAYPYVAGIDGNDPRLIDVAVLSKYPIVSVRSYQHLKGSPSSRTFIFSRDCLEVDVQLRPRTILTLYVNHLKSMMDGREASRARREQQAGKVTEIVQDRFGKNAGRASFVILGDMNDYRETDSQGTSGILELVDWDQVENVVERLPVDEQWTHYFKGRRGTTPVPEGYHQLDYLLLSRSLARKNRETAPLIFREGLPTRAARYSGRRFNGIGKDKPKASDHCPVAFDLTI